MEYFKNLSGVSILVVFILIFLPLLQVMAEEKLKTDTNEGNTESMKNEGANDYTITIRSTDKGMSIFTDSKLIGKTPLTLTLKEGESLQIYGKNNKGDIVFKTTLEGGKMPQGLLIHYNERPGLSKRAVFVILGVAIGATASIIYIVIALFRTHIGE